MADLVGVGRCTIWAHTALRPPDRLKPPSGGFLIRKQPRQLQHGDANTTILSGCLMVLDLTVHGFNVTSTYDNYRPKYITSVVRSAVPMVSRGSPPRPRGMNLPKFHAACAIPGETNFAKHAIPPSPTARSGIRLPGCFADVMDQGAGVGLAPEDDPFLAGPIDRNPPNGR